MNKLVVGVTGTGSLIGQAIIKSLKLSDLRARTTLVGFDYFPGTIGSYWTDRHHLLPDILSPSVREEEWVEAIIEIISREDISYLFVGVDFELAPLASVRERIHAETGCCVLVSSPDVVRIADDKYLTSQFLLDHSLSAPASFLPGDFYQGSLGYPCIVKPRIGQRSRGVHIVHNHDELMRAVASLKDPVIQELVGDPHQEFTCGVVCFENACQEAIVLRRDLKEGNTAAAYYEGENTAIEEYIHRVAEALKPFGACNFQLRLDREGTPKLFEINARHSGTTYMRALFGFNEVEYILKMLRGETPAAIRLRRGVVKRYYEEQLFDA
jgi:carbamoyl-phosphate synthase large subunit